MRRTSTIAHSLRCDSADLEIQAAQIQATIGERGAHSVAAHRKIRLILAAAAAAANAAENLERL